LLISVSLNTDLLAFPSVVEHVVKKDSF